MGQIERILNRFGQETIQIIQANLSRTNTNATGETSRSLESRVVGETKLKVTGKPFINVVETGRKPGKRPPISPIVRWLNSGKTSFEGKIDSVAYAAKIMKEQMEVFINFDPEKRIEPDEDLDVEEAPTNDNLYRSVSELELSVRSINCLQNAKIETIADLVQKTEAEMLRTKNFGRKSLNEIKTILSAMNLSLGMKLENFDPDANPVEKAKKE